MRSNLTAPLASLVLPKKLLRQLRGLLVPAWNTASRQGLTLAEGVAHGQGRYL